MSRKAKEIKDPKKAAQHARNLERRRERHKEKRTLEMAAQAADGAADFEALVEAERQRQETLQQTRSRQGGSKSPKIMSQAREDLALAFDLMGGVPALVVWGRSNPTDFYRIWARLVPTTAAAETQTLPLEDLLSKLAAKEGKSVMDAAVEIGQETLAAAQKNVIREDAQGYDPERTIN